MPARTAIVLLLVLGAIPALPGCGGGSSRPKSGASSPSHPFPSNPSGGGAPVESELDRQLRLFCDQGIVNYRYRLQRIVFGPQQYTDAVLVTVRSGTVVSQVYEQSGNPVNPMDPSWWPTIDGLFALIQDAYDRNAAVIQVAYDPDLGYPTSASIDYDLGLGDDEHAFTADQFVPLP
jgi:hypothetical protein